MLRSSALLLPLLLLSAACDNAPVQERRAETRASHASMPREAVCQPGSVTVTLSASAPSAPIACGGASVELIAIEDSRCPEGVTCIWEGLAEVHLSVESASGSHDILLSTEAPMHQEHFGQGFFLEEVSPATVDGDEELTVTVLAYWSAAW